MFRLEIRLQNGTFGLAVGWFSGGTGMAVGWFSAVAFVFEPIFN